jgi:hypothetical protein
MEKWLKTHPYVSPRSIWNKKNTGEVEKIIAEC